MPSIWIAAAAIALSHPASATLIETCHLDGRMVLTSQTEIECWKNNFKIEPGSEIVTNGYKLLVYSEGTLEMDGFKIQAFETDEASQKGRDAGGVTIEAVTLKGGQLSVVNDAQKNGSGGEIVIKTQTFKDFKKPVLSVQGAGAGRDGGVFIYTAKGQIALSEMLENTIQ